MADGLIRIDCPAMLVENTGWRARSIRRAVELPCTGYVKAGGNEMELRNFRFPSCLIRPVEGQIGKWMVDPVTAFGDHIIIDYPAEPVHRQGSLMVAEAIMNNVERSHVVMFGVKYEITAPLPEALADPGPLWGLFSYTVRPVTITGTLRRLT